MTVLYKRQATVQGPTPPGTGVMYPATSATLNRNKIEILKIFLQKYKVEKILKGSLDSISSPSSSVKIQIMGEKVCLRFKGKTLLGIVNKSLLTIAMFCLYTFPAHNLNFH